MPETGRNFEELKTRDTGVFKIFIHLAAPGLSCGMQDLQLQHVGSSSLTRDGTQPAALGVQSLSHRTTGEVPPVSFKDFKVQRQREMRKQESEIQCDKCFNATCGVLAE